MLQLALPQSGCAPSCRRQVDSEEGTLAANFWWEGAVSSQLGGPMDRWGCRPLSTLLLGAELCC